VVDRLQTYLQALEVSGVLYCRSELFGEWGVEFPEMESWAMFHLVTEGRMWLEAGDEGRWVEAGDFVLLPRGAGHTIKSGREAGSKSLFAHDRTVLNERCEILRVDGEGERVLLMCGVVRLDHPGARRLVGALPPVVHLRTGDSDSLAGLVGMIAAEAPLEGPGSFSVLTKLADVLIIQALRHWLGQGVHEGWLGALGDERIGKALEVMHSEPGRAWSVEALASEVAMSRAAFSHRFTMLVGETAMAYLTRWRMDLAAKRLSGEAVTVGSLAFELGYESETSFSQAFKRTMGVSPGAYRKRARSIYSLGLSGA